MEKQISIIIPTYNMEKYIGKCLDSLLIPEFDQVEVLVVNDGSKDRSSEIAHSYADRYPGSIRVIDKPNGNYGSCINAALPLATGRYVKVLDADDTFDTETFSKFVALIENVDDDMLITPFVDVDEEGVITRRDTENYYNVNLYSTYAFEEIKDSALALYPTMHRLTYKRSLFDRLDYRQTEGISYTDTEWSMLPMAYIDTIRFTDIYLYRYLVGRAGQTMAPDKLAKSMDQLFVVSKDMIAFYKSADLSDERREFLNKKIISFIKSNIMIGLRSGSREVMDSIKEHDNWLKQESPLMYDAVGNIRYDERIPFQFVNDIRKKNYPTGYKVPKHVLYRLSIKIRLDKLFNR